MDTGTFSFLFVGLFGREEVIRGILLPNCGIYAFGFFRFL